MEHGGGGGERANPSGVDRLSALPEDPLLLILLRLDSTAEAARTSVLARRWRRVWQLLPELRFPVAPEPSFLASVLAHDATLRYLSVRTQDAAAESVAAWLPAAARRLSGSLLFENLAPGRNGNGNDQEEAGEGGAFELPCFECATMITLRLGFFHRLALPPAGVFARLTELFLVRVWFHGPYELGDLVSSQRCPCLQQLGVREARGLVDLAIRSKSLLLLFVQALDVGLRQLTVDAPALKGLRLSDCFADSRPVANISTPQLIDLMWWDSYDPTSVHFENLGQIDVLSPTPFWVYGLPDFSNNRDLQRLLERFPSICRLRVALVYRVYIGDLQYVMEELTVFPRLEVLDICLANKGHAFGACVFHVLRMCTSLKEFVLAINPRGGLQEQYVCPSGCACAQPTNWRTEELTLNVLQQVTIIDMEGTDHEIAFVKRLFSWARVLKRMRIVYTSLTASKANELHEKMLSLAMPETCITLEAE